MIALNLFMFSSLIITILASPSLYYSIFGNLKNCYGDMNLELEIKYNIKNEVQKLKMLIPNKTCKNNKKTIFFEENYHKPYGLSQTPIKTENLEIKEKSKFVYVWKENIYHPFLSDFFQKAGLFMADYPFKEFSSLHWLQCRYFDLSFFTDLQDYQAINKNTHAIMFYGKDGLYQRYKIFQKKYGYHVFNFIPETYLLPEDTKEVIQKFKHYKLNMNDLWLIKSRKGMVGSGISFFTDLKHLTTQSILMKYIQHPLLLNGRKCDLRLYVLVTSMNPLKIYFYEEGFVKIAVDKYNLSPNGLANKNIHLTNCNLNTLNKKYVYSKNETSQQGNLWTLSTFLGYLEGKKVNTSALLKNIKDVIIKYYLLYVNEINSYNIKYKVEKKHSFMIWGADIILDANYKPYLLENNECTEMGWHHDWATNISLQMVRDTMNIVGLEPIDRSSGANYHNTKTLSEIVDDSICEFTRPTGGFERIFPDLNTISKYQKFVPQTKENVQLWEEMRKLKMYN